jgi:asparagine synthase (glutamine-hydrolysing)
MCGILGYSHNKTQLPAGVLASAVAALDHRGPDQAGQYSSEHISLGAVRLSIRDLTHGDQPLFSADRDVVIVFNGEIYNHQELRAELEAEGLTFDTNCDTEVVLKAFLRWGKKSFARLRGMFGVGIWVESERRLFLARDRMGIKPLYYTLQNGEIFFGSELKCIFAHPKMPRRIDLDGLNCFLSLNWVPGPYTLVQGVKKLMPGEVLEWQSGHCTVETYVPKLESMAAPKTIEDACEELDHLLKEAVKEELVSDVPLGVWLSGGLDSSSIVHYATQVYPGRLKTFSITFKGRSFDESEYIKEVSAHFGTQHFDFDLNTDADLIGAIEQMAYHSDEPSADAGALPVWFLAQMTRKHVTVILSGEGGDEIFAGYLTYKANRYAAMARNIPAPFRRLALKTVGMLPVSDEKISFEYKLKRFLQGSLMSPELAHVYWNGTFTEDEKREIFYFADDRPLRNVVGHMKSGSGLKRYLEFDQRYYLADDILYKVDRMSMAHSLEVRPPFLDPRVVEFANRLPSQFKLNGGVSKYVLRRLMKDKLPQSVLRRPKIGFDIPIHEWFRGELRPLLLETLSEETVSANGLFDWQAIKRLIDNHLERKANVGYHLWGLLVLFIWMKKWNMETAPAKERILMPSAELLAQVGSSSLPLASSSSSA